MRDLFLFGAVLVGLASCVGSEDTAATEGAPAPPNVVVVFTDDLGYGDLGTFGHPTISTPRLDQLAQEGKKMTQFYVAAPVCTPSRAGLLTGIMPHKTVYTHLDRDVYFPDHEDGMYPSRFTLAELVKQSGYATACIGKWHLGHLPEYLPTNQGFDEYFGIPYSNDMFQPQGPNKEGPVLPLMENETVLEEKPDQGELTRRYTERAMDFISRHQEQPFFLYLAHNMPHIPLFAADRNEDTSLRGLYGDVVEEIDFQTGRLVDHLDSLGLLENTLVIFTSDNGPWHSKRERGGSAGLLRGHKGLNWEGGVRVPTLFYWKGKIQSGPSAAMGSTLDLMPTLATLTSSPLPDTLQLDGYDLSQTLLGDAPSPRKELWYYYHHQLEAYRYGPWKVVFNDRSIYERPSWWKGFDQPQLYHLEHDPSEKYDKAEEYPDTVAMLVERVRLHLAQPSESRTEVYLAED